MSYASDIKEARDSADYWHRMYQLKGVNQRKELQNLCQQWRELDADLTEREDKIISERRERNQKGKAVTEIETKLAALACAERLQAAMDAAEKEAG